MFKQLRFPRLLKYVEISERAELMHLLGDVSPAISSKISAITLLIPKTPVSTDGTILMGTKARRKIASTNTPSCRTRSNVLLPRASLTRKTSMA
jgi:hypothetical protein